MRDKRGAGGSGHASYALAFEKKWPRVAVETEQCSHGITRRRPITPSVSAKSVYKKRFLPYRRKPSPGRGEGETLVALLILLRTQFTLSVSGENITQTRVITSPQPLYAQVRAEQAICRCFESSYCTTEKYTGITQRAHLSAYP